MKENQELKQKLMKYFSLVLKKRVTETPEEINPKVLNMLTRKDLIDIIHHRYDGELPPDINLVEMENEALLQLIGDELFILAYVVQQWCDEAESEKSKVESTEKSIASTSPKKTENSPSKSTKDGK